MKKSPVSAAVRQAMALSLRLVMGRKDMTRKDLGEMIDLDNSAIGRACKGKQIPSRAALGHVLQLTETDEERYGLLLGMGREAEARALESRIDVANRCANLIQSEGGSADFLSAMRWLVSGEEDSGQDILTLAGKWAQLQRAREAEARGAGRQQPAE